MHLNNFSFRHNDFVGLLFIGFFLVIFLFLFNLVLDLLYRLWFLRSFRFSYGHFLNVCVQSEEVGLTAIEVPLLGVLTLVVRIQVGVLAALGRAVGAAPIGAVLFGVHDTFAALMEAT